MMHPTAHAPLRTDQRPLYAKASDAVKDFVLRSGCAPGDQLPSEIELSQRLGISRPTLREALHQLEEEGAIVRRHGVGTFVAQPQPVIQAGLEVLESLERLAERSGLHVEMGEVVIQERPATGRESKGLSLAAAASVTAIRRVMLANGRRIAHLIDVVPQAYLRQSDLDADFAGSVLEHFLACGRPALSHSRTELCAETADHESAFALQIRRGAPLMKLEAQLFATDGQIVDYSVSHFIPGCFHFHVVRRVANA